MQQYQANFQSEKNCFKYFTGCINYSDGDVYYLNETIKSFKKAKQMSFMLKEKHEYILKKK